MIQNTDVQFDLSKATAGQRASFIMKFAADNEDQQGQALADFIMRCGTIHGEPVTEETLCDMDMLQYAKLIERASLVLCGGDTPDIEDRAKN